MLDAKNQRKCVQADERLLENRLAHLRSEDAKAQKRIEEANRRAKEIEAVKKRNVEHQRAKQRAYEQLQNEIRSACDYNSRFRSCYNSNLRLSLTTRLISRPNIVHVSRAP